MRDFLSRFYQLAAEVVHQHEGVIDEVHGDGLVILFGHVIAHEDEPIRAVRCALELQQSFSAYQDPDVSGIAARIGIHRGYFAIGSGAEVGALPTTAVGTATYLAARLQALAPIGGVAIAGALMRLVQRSFHLESLGRHDLKGFDQPQEVFSVVGELPEPQLSAEELCRVVGRSREYKQIDENWASASTGKGRLLLLSGEAGIGKTTLVNSFRERIDRDRFFLFEVSCGLAKNSTSLEPFARLLRTFIAAGCGTDHQGLPQIDGYLEWLGLPTAEVLPALQTLLGPSFKPTTAATSPSHTVAATRQATMRLLTRALTALSKQKPILLILEDLHWADPSSLDLIDQWIDEMSLSRVLVIATCRQIPRSTWPVRPDVVHVQLAPLNRVEAEHLLLDVARKKLLPLSLQESILTKSHGIPLFIRELTLMMIESQPPSLEEGEHTWIQIRPIPGDAIPSSVEDAIVARLDQLHEGLSILQLAAAIGDPFLADNLGRIAKMLHLSGHASLKKAIESGIIIADLQTPGLYHFCHALVRQALYQMIPEKTRRRYHSAIAAALRSADGTIPRDDQPHCAYHLYHAGRYEASLDYWEEAAEIALSRQAVAEAKNHLAQALNAIDKIAEPARYTQAKTKILERQAPMLMAVDGWASPSVGSACRALFALYSETHDTEKVFWTRYGYWAHRFVSGELSEAIQDAHELRNAAAQSADPCMALAAQNALSYTYCYRGELDHSLKEAQSGINKLTEADDLSVASHFHLLPSVPLHAAIAKALWMQDRKNEAWNTLTFAREWAQRLDHVTSIATAISTQLDVSCWQENWDDTSQYAAELTSFSRKHGLSIWRTYAEMMEAKSRLEHNPCSQSVDDFLRWVELFRQTGTGFELPSTTAMVCRALLLQDNPDAAMEISTNAQALSSRKQIGLMLPELLRMQACIHKEMCNRAGAFRALEEARTMAIDQHAISLLQAIDQTQMSLNNPRAPGRLC